jgi:hypothetical protein
MGGAQTKSTYQNRAPAHVVQLVPKEYWGTSLAQADMEDGGVSKGPPNTAASCTLGVLLGI